MDTPLAQTPANFGTKRRFFGKLVPNPIRVPNLKLLASTVAEINRRSQIFSDASLAQAPPILVLNVVFGKILPNPSCIPNLKLLASTVAKVSRQSQIFLDDPLAQTPASFGPKRCIW